MKLESIKQSCKLSAMYFSSPASQSEQSVSSNIYINNLLKQSNSSNVDSLNNLTDVLQKLFQKLALAGLAGISILGLGIWGISKGFSNRRSSTSGGLNNNHIHELPRPSDMVLVTTDTIPHKEIKKIIQIVNGVSVKSANLFGDWLSDLKNGFIGGNLDIYAGLISEGQKEAVEIMIEQARKAGANAIVNIRFSTSSVADRAAEIMVTGDAVCI